MTGMDIRIRPPFRTQVWKVIHEGRGPTGRAYNFLSLVLILFSIAILPLEFMPGLERFESILIILEVSVTAAFTVDYLLHLWSAPNPVRYVFSLFGLVDLLSVVPFYLNLVAIPYVRGLRLIRLLRIAEIDPAGAAEEEQELHDGIGLAEGERVEYIVTRHPVYMVVHGLPSLVSASFGIALLITQAASPPAIAIGIALLLFSLILLWRAWLDFSYDVIYVTTDRLIFQNTHLLGRSVNQVPFQAIMNIKPSYPNIISYLLRYGSIIIDTPSAREGQIRLHMVRAHEHAAHIIMNKNVTHARQGSSSAWR